VLCSTGFLHIGTNPQINQSAFLMRFTCCSPQRSQKEVPTWDERTCSAKEHAWYYAGKYRTRAAQRRERKTKKICLRPIGMWACSGCTASLHALTMSGKSEPVGWYVHSKLHHPRTFFPFGYLVSLRRDNSPHFYAWVNFVSQPDVSGNRLKTSTLREKYYMSKLIRKKDI